MLGYWDTFRQWINSFDARGIIKANLKNIYIFKLKAHGITGDAKYSLKNQYVWKGVIIMCGAYLFYVCEILMKILISMYKVKLNIKLKKFKDF